MSRRDLAACRTAVHADRSSAGCSRVRLMTDPTRPRPWTGATRCVLPVAGPLQRRPRGRAAAARARSHRRAARRGRVGRTSTGMSGPCRGRAGKAARSRAFVGGSTISVGWASPRSGSLRSSSSARGSTAITATASRISSRSIPASARDATCVDLVEAAHARGIRIILDIILNHSGDNWGYLPPNSPPQDARNEPAFLEWPDFYGNPATPASQAGVRAARRTAARPRRRGRQRCTKACAGRFPESGGATRARGSARLAAATSKTRTPSTSAPTSSR